MVAGLQQLAGWQQKNRLPTQTMDLLRALDSLSNSSLTRTGDFYLDGYLFIFCF
jgi:hypothetical protein